MDRDTRRKLIDTYKDGYRVVSEALTGATERELDAQPAPGKWTARELIMPRGPSLEKWTWPGRQLLKKNSDRTAIKSRSAHAKPPPRSLAGN